jgi:hemolysin activation/secretion protein
MREQVTISGAAIISACRATHRAVVVIIALASTTLTARMAAATDVRLATVAQAAPLTTVIVDGATAFPASRLFAAYRDELGMPLSRDGARAIRAALTDLYVRDGYVKPVLILDEALAARGVLRVQVHEAQVSSVVFDGDGGRFRDALEDIGTRLENARPLRQSDIPDALRAMRQLAGLSVTATTRPDAQLRNAFELLVRVDFSPVDGVVRMNNRGTDQVGPAFMLGQVFANGLLGRQERIGLIFAAATEHEEYLGGGLYVDAPLGTNGTRGNALLFRSHSAPHEAPLDLDDEYTRARETLRVSRPLRQSSELTLTAGVSFEADDLTVERAGAAIREDRLRIIETSLKASWRGTAQTQYSMSLQLRKGLDSLGAGLQAPTLAVDPRRASFFISQLQGSAYHRFAERWSVRLDGFSQFTNQVLPDTERFKIGGDRLGRGFEVAEIAGDRGLGAKIDLRREMVNTQSLVGRVSAYGFYDFGAAWKRSASGRESAATAGTGVAISGGALTGYLELATPLTGTDVEGKRRKSVFAEISYRF